MALERESATYWAKLPELLGTAEGKFVVIHGEDVAAMAENFDQALEIGFDRFEPGEFLVKQVLRAEPILYFSWDFRGCPDLKARSISSGAVISVRIERNPRQVSALRRRGHLVPFGVDILSWPSWTREPHGWDRLQSV